MSARPGPIRSEIAYDKRNSEKGEGLAGKRKIVSVCDYDAVIVFSRRHNLKPGVRSSAKYSAKAFMNTLLGIKVIKQKSGPVKELTFVNESRRILKTDRCFCNEDGSENSKLKKLELQYQKTEDTVERDQLQAQKLEEMKRCLMKEYMALNNNSDEPCQRLVYEEMMAKTIAKRMQLACGLDMKMRLTVDKDEIIMVVKADNADLRIEAERTHYKVQTHNQPFLPDTGGMMTASHAAAPKFNSKFRQLHPQRYAQARTMLQDRCDHEEVAPYMDPGLFRMNKQPELLKAVTRMGHSEKAYSRFSGSASHHHGRFGGGEYFAPYHEFDHEVHHQPFYRHYSNKAGELSEFREVDRIRLTRSMIARHINILAMKYSKVSQDIFALHDPTILEELRRTWLFNWNINTFFRDTPLEARFSHRQPLLQLRDYFGEKVALYFAWLEDYTAALRLPSLYGVLLMGLELTWAEGRRSAAVRWLGFWYTWYLMYWASDMCESWKRKNAMLNLWWGTMDYLKNEKERPQFHGVVRYHKHNDIKVLQHRSLKMYHRGIMQSCFIIFVVVILFCIGVGMVLEGKRRMIEAEIPFAGPIAGAANAAIITLGNEVGLIMGRLLVTRENHRTQRMYENMYNTYTFSLRFCVSYAVVLYIIFVKKWYEGACVNDDCMSEARMALASTLIVLVTGQNTWEALKPTIYSRLRLLVEDGFNLRHMMEGEAKMEQVEIECKYEPYEEKESMKDYAGGIYIGLVLYIRKWDWALRHHKALSYCTRTVRVLYAYCTRTVRVLYAYCTLTVLPIYSHCTPIVLPLYSHCNPLYSHCTLTVPSPYSHCTLTVCRASDSVRLRGFIFTGLPVYTADRLCI
jgi:hypothetical protein